MEISNKLYEALGRFSVAYGDLQYMTVILFNSFRISSKSGFDILDHFSYKILISKIEKYVAQINLDSENFHEILRMCREIHSIREKRNELFHSIFLTHNETEKRLDLSKLRIDGELNYIDVDERVVNEIIKDIEDLRINLIYSAANISKK